MNRRVWVAGAAAVGVLAGVGVAWQRNAGPAGPAGSGAAVDPALAALWGLTLNTPEGGSLALKSLQGKPLLINFWATWCPPCIEELPLLNAFSQQNSANGWQVLGLAVDKLSAVQAFLARQPLAFPVVMAGMEGVALSQSLGNGPGGLPFTVVVGAKGQVLDRKIGRVSPDDLQRWHGLK